MIARRIIDTPGYKAREWTWRRLSLRITRYALGELDRCAVQIRFVVKGNP